MIILRFLPVTDLASYSIAEGIIFSEGLVDFLIDRVICRNILAKTFLRCFLPDKGSIRYLWVAKGRSNMTLMLLL